MKPVDPVALTLELLRRNTVNPPGNEASCLDFLGEQLAAAGFEVHDVPLAPGRPNLIARPPGTAGLPALALTGHVDVVPLGTKPWRHDPFGAEIVEGRLFGRGSSDMKSGTAAIVAAAIDAVREAREPVPVELVLTSCEEVGLKGAAAVAESGRLGRAGALVVAEPTGLRPATGYRGVLWCDLLFEGRTAHASEPDKGDNALLKAARAALRLAEWDFDGARHPALGRPTLNVARMEAGQNYNSVPDFARLGLDLRLLPEQPAPQIMRRLSDLSGCCRCEQLESMPAVWTDPDHPWLQAVRRRIKERLGGEVEFTTVPYCTDASRLAPAYGDVPVLILGPGEIHQAHQTDEWCEVGKIRAAAEIYRSLIRDWADRFARC